ncbi:helix-turn-helix transcriptional regulator [Martelella mediterranea]|uniref:Uncharacterized protein n=1 Tax=Martelella mediterranea TaxID=293089 RepID=A0A4R3NV81_9HYPH|nr:helix-turn-helix transcriptional regulator [Martelella mediterranea]TCT37672.1 hypothetical protein EDC90_101762 [Martelella mediterranea]
MSDERTAHAPGALLTKVLHHLRDGVCLTIDTLEEDLGLTRRQISDSMSKLIMRGLVERAEVGCYQLTDDGIKARSEGLVLTSGPTGPHTGRISKPWRDTLRQRAWAAMRMSASFTLGDLVVAASRDDRDATSNAGRYVRALVLAGYVIEMPVRQKGTRMTSNGFKRYRLVRNTGPVAPVYRPGKHTIYDYNLREDVSCDKNN